MINIICPDDDCFDQEFEKDNDNDFMPTELQEELVCKFRKDDEAVRSSDLCSYSAEKILFVPLFLVHIFI